MIKKSSYLTIGGVLSSFVFLHFSCKTPTESDVQGARDVADFKSCKNGALKVTCVDGRTEIVSEQDFMKNRVCQLARVKVLKDTFLVGAVNHTSDPSSFMFANCRMYTGESFYVSEVTSRSNGQRMVKAVSEGDGTTCLIKNGYPYYVFADHVSITDKDNPTDIIIDLSNFPNKINPTDPSGLDLNPVCADTTDPIDPSSWVPMNPPVDPSAWIPTPTPMDPSSWTPVVLPSDPSGWPTVVTSDPSTWPGSVIVTDPSAWNPPPRDPSTW